ncbi:iron-containing alcohol dehydrogenase family protein [Salinirubellus salinus]|uniref:Iron-containing alcohol dehydrogenase family protein n=1 Tax=Salinirubellus salinus TaxID=1364945 RepID=A0A9E7R1V2_9EURY|nr:iron-containing alcohol dehydrogenase family protein [Salinirubellus salinus]UWM54056.1 iron-containing alcohol dehydrogenase family protein [Salinirubellus salinus]
MDDRIPEFRFPYDPPTVRYGRDAVEDLAAELAAIDVERALVVAGETTGTSDAVGGRVEAGLGDRLVETFAETTTDKRIATAHEVAELADDLDADALVAVGGGSSLDVAKVAATLRETGQSLDEARAALREGGLALPQEATPTPIVAVPTTLAGAELSVVAGITDAPDSEGDLVVRGGVFDPRLMPAAVVYDPSLFETTPHGVLCASAMNGFDKGLETVYARNATPVTDATAMRGLSLLRRGLPELGAGEWDADTLYDCIVGTMLVQYGCSRSDGTTLSVIHAYGHGVARGFAVQQGGAHAIVLPDALEHLFGEVDARRDLLAEAFDVAADSPEATAEGVVEAVTEVRDALGLPTRLRDVEDMDESDLPKIADVVVEDGFMRNRPEGYDPTAEDVLGVLERAW